MAGCSLIVLESCIIKMAGGMYGRVSWTSVIVDWLKMKMAGGMWITVRSHLEQTVFAMVLSMEKMAGGM